MAFFSRRSNEDIAEEIEAFDHRFRERAQKILQLDEQITQLAKKHPNIVTDSDKEELLRLRREEKKLWGKIEKEGKLRLKLQKRLDKQMGIRV